MKTRTILLTSFTALAMSIGASGLAATAADGQADNSANAGMMRQGAASGPGAAMMRGGASGGGMTSGGMAGGGMMGMGGEAGHGGMGMMNMMGMMRGGMGGHGMMNFSKGLDRADAMRMRGEMMRAIGNILIKYADKVHEPAKKQ
ncbi:MAG: hypothetical protein EPN41_00675 [Candidimonas sp.]|nr:MAG: hypothetical protein EPN41_00675 [Candidimonas sp.]